MRSILCLAQLSRTLPVRMQERLLLIMYLKLRLKRQRALACASRITIRGRFDNSHVISPCIQINQMTHLDVVRQGHAWAVAQERVVLITTPSRNVLQPKTMIRA